MRVSVIAPVEISCLALSGLDFSECDSLLVVETPLLKVKLDNSNRWVLNWFYFPIIAGDGRWDLEAIDLRKAEGTIIKVLMRGQIDLVVFQALQQDQFVCGVADDRNDSEDAEHASQ